MVTDTTEGSAGTDGDRVLLVSVDAHVAPTIEAYRPYCEAADLAAFDEFVDELEDQRMRVAFLTAEAPSTRAYLARISDEYGTEALNADQHERLRNLDEDGVAAEVIFHGALNRHPIPFFENSVATALSPDLPADGRSRELRAIGIRMYNRWLADWCSIAPDRLLGVAHIPMWDVDATVAEIRAAHAAGLRAINLPAPRRGLLGYNDTAWDAVWAVCVELGVSLHTHGGGGDIFPVSGQGAVALQLAELGVAGRRGMWQLIFGGVFERFPDLHMFATEQNGAWVVDMLSTLDSAYWCPLQRRLSPQIDELLPRLPSEYFRSNCFVGASFMSRHEALAALDGEYWENVAWGRDFPHPEGTWPYTDESLSATFTGLPPVAVRRMLGETAVRAMGLDGERLRAVAAEIGPSLEQVLSPLESTPAGADISMAFRTVGAFA
jgi:predicted TIM-barrel fold metal-dependent hydrolase